MTQAHDLGKKAEALAAGYLQKSGYALLARNYRYLKSEVDLITYVFKGDDWEQDHIEDAFYPLG
jgi:Holliday junction resolvase-like predicted endonuclease